MQIVFLVFLFIFGACIGSFLCCQVRRLRRREQGKKPLPGRSVCPKCRYQLKWYDNLPIISWIFLRGKCRRCHAKIGLAEILSELALATGFLMIGITIDIVDAAPIAWGLFVLQLVFVSLLGFLAIYDAIYGELPTLTLTLSIICAIIIVTLREWASFSDWSDLGAHLINIVLAVCVLGGLYLFLYLVSKGKWVGDGDWLLGIALALVLGTPWLALITLFLANLLACLIMLPFVIKNRTHRIYFGPFMVVAFMITHAFAGFFSSMI